MEASNGNDSLLSLVTPELTALISGWLFALRDSALHVFLLNLAINYHQMAELIIRPKQLIHVDNITDMFGHQFY